MDVRMYVFRKPNHPNEDVISSDSWLNESLAKNFQSGSKASPALTTVPVNSYVLELMQHGLAFVYDSEHCPYFNSFTAGDYEQLAVSGQKLPDKLFGVLADLFRDQLRERSEKHELTLNIARNGVFVASVDKVTFHGCYPLRNNRDSIVPEEGLHLTIRKIVS